MLVGLMTSRRASWRGREAEAGHLVVDAADAAAVEGVAEAVPGPFGGGPELVPVEQDDGLEAAEREGQAVVLDVGGAAEVFEAVGVAVEDDEGVGGGEGEAFGEAALAEVAGGLCP